MNLKQSEYFRYKMKGISRQHNIKSDCRKTSIVVKNGVEGRSPQQGLGAVAPHSAPARTPGVYAQRLCTMQSQQSIHSLSRGKGFGDRDNKSEVYFKNRLFLQADQISLYYFFYLLYSVFTAKMVIKANSMNFSCHCK